MRKLHSIAIYLLLQASLGLGLHEDTFVQAIQEAHHLKPHLPVILHTVDITLRSFCDETSSPLSTSPWAAIILFLLKAIHLAARDDMGVRIALVNAREELTNMLEHICHIGSESERHPELERYRAYFKRRVNFSVLFYNQDYGEYQRFIPHPLWSTQKRRPEITFATTYPPAVTQR